MTRQLYIGLMSGTSLDGIDAVVVDFGAGGPRLIASHMEPLPADIHTELLSLTQPGSNEIDRMGVADTRFADLQVKAVQQLLQLSGIDAASIRAIGSHGQTIRHRPDFNTPFTLQIGDSSRMAEQLGITVVDNFRRRDMAAGGEGAPLVPAFHDRFFRTTDQHRVILNIGGIANVTVLDKHRGTPAIGYDTGPGNILMDAWINRHQGHACDLDGAWASGGRVDAELLQQLLDIPYLSQKAPKSTGRELFHIGWLDYCLAQRNESIAAVDVQATLLEFTARSISDALLQHRYPSLEIYLCGGGARNGALRQRLQQLLAPYPVSTTDVLGIPCEWLEACAFAWLAKACLEADTGNLPSVTGARGKRILGAIHQA